MNETSTKPNWCRTTATKVVTYWTFPTITPCLRIYATQLARLVRGWEDYVDSAVEPNGVRQAWISLPAFHSVIVRCREWRQLRKWQIATSNGLQRTFVW